MSAKRECSTKTDGGFHPNKPLTNPMAEESTIEELIAKERWKIISIKSKRLLFMIFMASGIIVTMGYSFTVGSSSLSAVDAYKILINQAFPGTFEGIPEKYVFIMRNLRAPRVLVGVCVGALLAIGGCLMQTVLKNPLATPYTLGVSSGASFGACLYFVFGITVIKGTTGLITNAFIFSMVPAAVMLFAITRKKVDGVVMILSGIAISYVFGSANTLMQYFGSDEAVKNVVFWAVGDLTAASMWMVPILIAILLFYFLYAIFMGNDLDIMKMGDDTAKSLGVNTEFVRISAIIITCLVMAVVVSFVGPIGFVCLVAPHISRKVVGSDIRWVVPFSALLGAILLLTADMVAKTVLSPIMLPVGAITALIGAPLMVWMLYLRKKSFVANY